MLISIGEFEGTCTSADCALVIPNQNWALNRPTSCNFRGWKVAVRWYEYSGKTMFLPAHYCNCGRCFSGLFMGWIKLDTCTVSKCLMKKMDFIDHSRRHTLSDPNQIAELCEFSTGTIYFTRPNIYQLLRMADIVCASKI